MGVATCYNRPVIRSFQYRSPRLTSILQIEFWSDGTLYTGESKDLGLDGLRARMDRVVAAGAEGRLKLRYSGQTHYVHASVAYVQGEEAGFSFRINDPDEEEALRAMLSVVGGLNWID